MSLNCYIVDNEMHAIEVLADLINESQSTSLLGFNTDAIVALNEVNEKMPTVLFLDIDMPKLNGFEFSKLIPGNIKVVFVTASPDFAIQAFDNAAYDYLVKPVTYSRFHKCIQKILKSDAAGNVADPNEFFFIKCENKGKMVKVNFADIVYIESNSNYVVINVGNEQYKPYLTLTEIEKRLPKQYFIRIHKSFIINYLKIKQIDGNKVLMADKSTVQIGVTFRERVFDLFNRYMITSQR